MNKKTVLGVSIATVFTIAMLMMPMTTVDAVADFLGVDKAKIFKKKAVTLSIKAADTIPASPGAVGYGILTDGTLLVSVSHGGVYDSALQTDKDDPVWHNHFVDLTFDATNCDDNQEFVEALDGLAVNAERLSFASPGDVKVKGKHLTIWRAPTHINDINYFASETLSEKIESYELGSMTSGLPLGLDGPKVVSFELSVPIWADMSKGEPAAVCVNNVQAFDAKLWG